MRSVTAEWYEIKIKYDKMQEDGTQKKVTETYVISANSWGDAERKIAKEMADYISGEWEIKSIAKMAYSEILFSDRDCDDKWYKAKVAFITIDEKTEKEKQTTVTFLLQGSSVSGAVKSVDEFLADGASNHTSIAVTETKIMDVFND